MKRKLLAVLLTITMIAAFTGCKATEPTGSNEVQASSETTADDSATKLADATVSAISEDGTSLEGKKITLILPTLQAEFFIAIADKFKEGLAAKGCIVNVATFDFDSSKQIECVENAIVANVDGIVAMVADQAADNVLKEAMDKNIKVIVAGVETANYDHCLMADNYNVGVQIAEMAADFANEKYAGKTQIAVMGSTANPNMADRTNGILETLKKILPDSEVVMYSETTKTGDGASFTENLLQQYPDCKIICSFSDSMAVEAVEVFKAAGKADDSVALFGCDCTMQGLITIAEGGIFRGTIDMGDIGTMMLEHTIRAMESDPTLEKLYIGENKKVTAENVSGYIK